MNLHVTYGVKKGPLALNSQKIISEKIKEVIPNEASGARHRHKYISNFIF